jgi:beta-lactamase superfamily II metal-dependent hydrolase
MVCRGEMGLAIVVDEGLRLQVLRPGALLRPAAGFNDHSIVMRLSYGGVSLLLTTDITAQAERPLLASDHATPIPSRLEMS